MELVSDINICLTILASGGEQIYLWDEIDNS
jgi:hypothetical protein